MVDFVTNQDRGTQKFFMWNQSSEDSIILIPVSDKVTSNTQNTYHVYTAPDLVRATENCDPHSTLTTPRPVRESI